MARGDQRPSERRPTAVLTFLFADIRGYTRFTNELGDEAGSRLSAKHAHVTTEGIEVHGGRVLELSGDEVVGIFESPRSALRAAVELQEAYVDETRLEPYLPLTIGIGLDVGEAVAVGDGYRGSVLNLAARLCSAAEAGTVIASESVVHLAGPLDGIGYAPLEGRPLKGFDQRVAAWLVAAEQPHQHEGGPPPATDAGSLPPELDPVVPIVGREADLRWLSWHWRRARHGHGRVVTVSGPRGSGRTRLLAELATLANGQGIPVSLARDPADSPPTPGPSLVLVEDIDTLPAAALDRVLARITAHPEDRLVVLTHAEQAPAAVMRRIDGLVAPEYRLALGPLDAGAVGEIARLYLAHDADDPPLQLLLEESEGLPAAVHRVASHWARAAAARRLGASARRTSRERRDLRASEAEMIDDVARLELARERSRLFVELEEAAPDEESAPAVTICPYKGLAAFEAVDADYYFGRERLIAELIARMVGSAFVGLIGASGSGKSSALQAGLLPALATGVLPGSDQWLQVPMRPGEHPMRQLEAALARSLPGDVEREADPRRALDSALETMAPGQRTLLIIDQFEELFTSVADEVESATFIDFITEPRAGLKVLVAVRADHYELCAVYPRLAQLVASSQVLVGPLAPDEIAAIIRHPAERVGLRVEPELVETLVSDVGAEPGGLPLLSTALLELWEARESGRLTLSAYRATGGVRGAVARMAEAAWAGLDGAEQSAARAVFLRLAGEGDGGAIVRRRVRLEEFDIDDNPDAANVLAILTAARLLTADDGHVEVAHEALLREWPRLRAWLEEEGAGRQLRLHLMGAARTWEEGGHEDGDLYRGARLVSVLDWSAEHEHEMNTVERDFVTGSRAALERDTERQRRTNRRLRGLLAGAGITLVVAASAATMAAVQLIRAEAESDRAEVAASAAAEQADRAEQEELAARRAEAVARSRELAASAIAVLDEDPSLSKLLALASASIADPPLQSISALHQAYAIDPIVARYAWPREYEVFELWTDFHPSGELLVASGAGNGPARYLEVFNLATERTMWSVEVPPDVAIGAPAFSADGALVIAGSYWEPSADPRPREAAREHVGIFAWETSSGREVFHHDLGPCGGHLHGVSDERLLIRALEVDLDQCFQSAAEEAVTVELLDPVSGKREVLATTVGMQPTALSADGSSVALPEQDDAVVIDLATGDRVVLETSGFGVGAQLDRFVRALSPDGSLLLYGGRPMMVWDVSTGEVVGQFDGHAGESWIADFGPDGETIFSTGRDGSLRHWRAQEGEELDAFPGVGTGVATALPDGRVLVTDPVARVAVVVDSAPRGELGAITPCEGFATSFSLHVSRTDAAYHVLCRGDTHQTTHVVDLASLELHYSLEGGEGQTIAIAPDGLSFARQEGMGDEIGSIIIRDLRTGEETMALDGLCTWNWRQVREGARRNDTGDCREFPETPFAVQVWQLKWSPDGSMIAASDHAGWEGYLVVWDAVTGRILHTHARNLGDGDVGWGPNDFIFSDDSSRLIVTYGGTDTRQVLATDSWELLTEVREDPNLQSDGFMGLAGVSAAGDLIGIGSFAGQGAGALHWLDPASVTGIPGRSLVQIHDGSVKSYALRDDGELLATGGADGFVRVWDVIAGRLVHEIPIGDVQVQGIAFATHDHLAVVSDDGTMRLVTMDVDELLEIVGRSLTRGFTATECGRFGFDDDCPTLDDLRRPSE